MNCAVATSTRSDLDTAFDDVVPRLSAALGGDPDLVVAFFTDHHTRDAEHLHRRLMDELSPRHLLRLWLSAEPRRPVTPNILHYDGEPGIQPIPGRTPSYETDVEVQ